MLVAIGLVEVCDSRVPPDKQVVFGCICSLNSNAHPTREVPGTIRAPLTRWDGMGWEFGFDMVKR